MKFYKAEQRGGATLLAKDCKGFDSVGVLNYNSNMKNYSCIKHFSVILNMIQDQIIQRFRTEFGMTDLLHYFDKPCHPELVSGFEIKSFKKSPKLAAFTLAEVLITLAIIGIVAAMTIPTLISNQKQRAWDTAANVFERKLEEALKTMNTQQTLSGYDDTLDFVNELSKHFKITRICQNNDILTCFEDKVYWNTIDISLGKSITEKTDISGISTASDLGQDDWDTDVVGVQFGNGATGIIAYNPNCSQNPYSNQITGTSCLAMLYDTDGFKSPNTLGKDLRSINVQIGCTFKSGNACYGTPFYPSIMTVQECQDLKDDLGIQQCCSTSNCAGNGDFWAGAAKVCGGTSNMPSHSQLLEIAKYVYNSSNIGVGVGPYYHQRDDDRSGLLGFEAYQNTGFQIWTNEASPSSSEQAKAFRFEPDYVYWHTPNRNSNMVQAVCIIN